MMGLLVLLLAGCRSPAGPTTVLHSPLSPLPAPASVTPSPPNASWVSVAILRLDYQTRQPKALHYHLLPYHPMGPAEARNIASRFLRERGVSYLPEEPFPEEPLRVGDFYLCLREAGDFGATALIHQGANQVLYAATTVWDGMGEHLYPEETVALSGLKTMLYVPGPRSFDVYIHPQVGITDGDDKAKAAWHSVHRTNLVQEFAERGPYSVLVYLHPTRVGVFDPATAEWVIFLSQEW